MWEALLSGKSGVDYITLFDPEYHTTKIAAEVKEFDPTDYLDRKQTRHTDRFVHFAIAASFEAAEQAKVNLNSDPEDIGVIIGSGIGGLTTLSAQFIELAEKGPSRVSPFVIPMMIADSASGQVSIALGMKGPNFCTTSACSSGADAIGVAYEFIKRGDTQAMVTGGSDAAITPIGVAGFNSAGALSTRNDEPQKASRPFDAERDGFIMGEGAAVLVLESLDYALNRGANILAEVIGDGATSDAYHITQPSIGGEGGAKAMQIALKKAGIKPEQVDYINAHGTSTPLNDKSETAALKTVFGDHAYRIPISSTKSMMGHLIGAAGAIEAVICVLAIRRGVIPPTMNLTHPDPECDLDYVPNAARQHKVRTALSNSFGFGGHNSVLVFREYNEEVS
jgi:3-oxoacyl-[acyl-carrier-protein] synthase II